MASAGCGGGAEPPPRLVDRSVAPPVPGVLENLDGAVMTRVAVHRASSSSGRGYRGCFQLAGDTPRVGSAVVERTGAAGFSVTFVAQDDLLSCDAIADRISDKNFPPGAPWCGGSAGVLRNGHLNDPRLHLCESRDGSWIAFAWIEPSTHTRWVVLREPGYRAIYRVAGSLPVRIEGKRRLRDGQARASYDLEEYALDGHRLRAYTLETAVAG